MGQPVSPRLQQIMAMVEALSPDEQRLLTEMLCQKVSEYRRVAASDQRYPLRGKPTCYADPFESVAEGDWEAPMVAFSSIRT